MMKKNEGEMREVGVGTHSDSGLLDFCSSLETGARP